MDDPEVGRTSDCCWYPPQRGSNRSSGWWHTREGTNPPRVPIGAVLMALASHVFPDSEPLFLPALTLRPSPSQTRAALIPARSPEGAGRGSRPKEPSPALVRRPTAKIPLPSELAALSLTSCTSALLVQLLNMPGLTRPCLPARTSVCPVVSGLWEGVLCWSSWLSSRP